MKKNERLHSFIQRLGNYIVPIIANLLAKSLRIKILNQDILQKIKSENRNYVVVFWHGKMFAGWYFFGRNFNNASALVSQSKDGEILARTLKKWGFEVVRGSSGKGGKDALSSMEKMLKSGFSLSITPDGPTGPANKMKAGAVVLSKKTSVPVILTGICYKRKYVFNSWDNFELPYFFSEVFIKLSEPIYIAPNFTYEETNSFILAKENELNKLNSDIEKIC